MPRPTSEPSYGGSAPEPPTAPEGRCDECQADEAGGEFGRWAFMRKSSYTGSARSHHLRPEAACHPVSVAHRSGLRCCAGQARRQSPVRRRCQLRETAGRVVRRVRIRDENPGDLAAVGGGADRDPGQLLGGRHACRDPEHRHGRAHRVGDLRSLGVDDGDDDGQ